MSRDLFAEDSTVRHVPRRSPWTIAGSVLAHGVILALLVVVPTLSALDNFVLHADESLTFVMPTVRIPPAPRPPQPAAAATAPPLNAHAAPLSASDRPVEPTSIPQDDTRGSTPPGSIRIDAGRPGPPGGSGPDLIAVAPPPTPVGPVRPGGNLKPPARTTYAAPVYPPLAKAARVEGSVIIEATIDEAGIVRDLRVLRSQPLFDQAALDAVRQWRYAPTRLNGVAVPVILTVTVMFSLK